MGLVSALAAPRKASRSHRLVALFMAACLTTVVFVALAGPAQAADVSATDLKVSVWPEYDDTRVLVIAQGELSDDVTLPVDISFPIPTGAEIGMACEVDPSGGHSCKPYQIEDQGDHQVITYKVEAQKKVFFEYYYEAFPAGAGERSFDFSFYPQFPVANLTMDIQEPARSTSFSVDPAMSQTTTDSNGFTYHLETYASPEVGEPITHSISYSKADAEPSVDPSEQTSSGGSMAAGGEGTNRGALYAVAGAVVFAVLLMAGYRTFRPQPAAAGRQSRRRRTNGARGSGQGSGKYCTECGSSIGRGARFCPECGEEQ